MKCSNAPAGRFRDERPNIRPLLFFADLFRQTDCSQITSHFIVLNAVAISIAAVSSVHEVRN
jgi:hypothetical protein